MYFVCVFVGFVKLLSGKGKPFLSTCILFVLQARPILTEIEHEDHVYKIADPHLEGNYDPKEMLRLVQAARACVRHSASMRPTMGQVG